MEQGRDFEAAIRILKDCARNEPQSADDHAALACALANRAASVAYAASQIEKFADFHERYIKDYALWRAAQEAADVTGDPSSQLPASAPVAGLVSRDGMPAAQSAATVMPPWIARALASHNRRFTAGTPPPVEPILRTPDDEKRLTITRDQAKADFDSLCRESIGEFDRAASLAANARDAAHINYLRGWSQLVVDRKFSTNGWPNVYSQEKVRAGFEQTIDLQPDTAVYCRSLGDAITDSSNRLDQLTTQERVDAIRAYRSALLHDPQDGARVSWRIFSLLEPPGLQPLKSNKETEAALRAAIHTDSGNAYLHYLQASMFLTAAESSTPGVPLSNNDIQRILEAVETANAMPQYSMRPYSQAVPLVFDAVWQYGRLPGDVPYYAVSPITNLSKSLRRLAASQQNSGDPDLALRILLAVVKMGRQVQSVVPTDNSVWSIDTCVLQQLISGSLTDGYTALANLYAAMNDSGRAREAAANAVEVKKASEAVTDDFMGEIDFGYRLF